MDECEGSDLLPFHAEPPPLRMDAGDNVRVSGGKRWRETSSMN